MNSDDRTALAVLLTLSAILFALGFWIRRREMAARRWPQVPGTIVTSKTDPPNPGRGVEKDVMPVIEYEFSYQGQSWRTSHWRFGNYTFGDRGSAEIVTSRYPVGLPVTIFVNVREPRKSVLEAKPSSLSWAPFWFGTLFLAISILVIFSIIQQAKGR
jgi:hypothetical protein